MVQCMFFTAEHIWQKQIAMVEYGMFNSTGKIGGANNTVDLKTSFSPSSIQVDEYRNIYVVDTTGHNIRTFENGTMATLAGMNKHASNTKVKILSMVVSTSGDLVYIEGSTIRTILKNGTVLTVCGKYVGYDGEPFVYSGCSGDGGLAISAQLKTHNQYLFIQMVKFILLILLIIELEKLIQREL